MVDESIMRRIKAIIDRLDAMQGPEKPGPKPQRPPDNRSFTEKLGAIVAKYDAKWGGVPAPAVVPKEENLNEAVAKFCCW